MSAGAIAASLVFLALCIVIAAVVCVVRWSKPAPSIEQVRLPPQFQAWPKGGTPYGIQPGDKPFDFKTRLNRLPRLMDPFMWTDEQRERSDLLLEILMSPEFERELQRRRLSKQASDEGMGC
jgi:hypothetical protein